MAMVNFKGAGLIVVRRGYMKKQIGVGMVGGRVTEELENVFHVRVQRI